MKKKSCSTNSIKKECCCPCKSKWTLLVLGILVIAVAAYLGFTRTKGLSGFKYQTEQFGDVKVLRFDVPGFEDLTLKQKMLAYYLYEASLAGRDIFYDQNYRHNLFVRHTLEEILKHYTGDRNTEEFKNFLEYTKMVWVSAGIHHHHSTDKMIPKFSKEYLVSLIQNSPKAQFPASENDNEKNLIQKITSILFDPDRDAKMVNQKEGTDLVKGSAVNFYEGLTQNEAEEYYQKIMDPSDPEPVSYGLNSKLMKIHGTIVEIPWKLGGMYSAAIEKMIFWLSQAATVAETDHQRKMFEKLIEYYKTGNLKAFDEYSILWLNNASQIDFTNGFIENYLDPLGKKGSYASIVLIKDTEATKRAKLLTDNVQWFEDHLPIDSAYKNEKANASVGIVVNQIAGNGDACGPMGFFGQNLPNASWIREKHGAKTNTIANIIAADAAVYFNSAALNEFSYSKEDQERERKYGILSSNVITDIHEILGHSSGKAKPEVVPENILKEYYLHLEESRAEAISLYYIMDPKLVDLGIIPNLEVAKAEYNNFLTYGLFRQLVRLKLGDSIEQSHMRARHLIAKWVFEKGQKENVIEKKIKDGKTYFIINDFTKMRVLIGDLIATIQRIKSEGDYEAGKKLVEEYAVYPDPKLHEEAIARWKKLNIAPYSAYIQPILTPVMKGEEIVDVKIVYPKDFTEQMMEYGEKYSFLPIYN